jgi:hypothetical protein
MSPVGPEMVTVDDGTRVVRVKNYKMVYDKIVNLKLRISDVWSLMFHADGSPPFRVTTSGDYADFTIFKRGVSRFAQQHFSDVYDVDATLPIKPAKFRDLSELLKYVDGGARSCAFYTSSRANAGAIGTDKEDSEDEIE